MWREFRPTVFFLLKFFGVYLSLYWLYGLYLASYNTQTPPVVDPITRLVTRQFANVASLADYQVWLEENYHLKSNTAPEQTYDSIWLNRTYAISVEEDYNGVSIMILFLAFMVGFGGKLLNGLFFTIAGLLIIHFANIGRLLFLGILSVNYGGSSSSFFHNYSFTAIIYLAVLFLWYLWVLKFNGLKNAKSN